MLSAQRNIAQAAKEKTTTTDDEFKCLIDTIKDSLTSLQAQQKEIDYALKLSAVAIAQQLLHNQALTLHSAYDIFKGALSQAVSVYSSQ